MAVKQTYQGPVEPRVLAKLPPPVQMGNDNSFAIKKMGDGRKNYGSVVKEYGPPTKPYTNPPDDGYYD